MCCNPIFEGLLPRDQAIIHESQRGLYPWRVIDHFPNVSLGILWHTPTVNFLSKLCMFFSLPGAILIFMRFLWMSLLSERGKIEKTAKMTMISESIFCFLVLCLSFILILLLKDLKNVRNNLSWNQSAWQNDEGLRHTEWTTPSPNDLVRSVQSVPYTLNETFGIHMYYNFSITFSNKKIQFILENEKGNLCPLFLKANEIIDKINFHHYKVLIIFFIMTPNMRCNGQVWPRKNNYKF